MPLRLNHCLPHTSYLGFFAAFSLNALPCFGEIVYLIYSYHATTYVDQQTVVPSFWFRRWRPGYLCAGMLYDVGMLVYCIYTEDIFVILIVVRLLIGFYQLYDQVEPPYPFLHQPFFDCTNLATPSLFYVVPVLVDQTLDSFFYSKTKTTLDISASLSPRQSVVFSHYFFLFPFFFKRTNWNFFKHLLHLYTDHHRWLWCMVSCSRRL